MVGLLSSGMTLPRFLPILAICVLVGSTAPPSMAPITLAPGTLSPVTTSSPTVTPCPRVPQIISAVIEPDLRGFTIQFDAETRYDLDASNRDRCTFLFRIQSLPLLGMSSLCILTSARSILVIFGGGATVLPEVQSLLLRNDAIQNKSPGPPGSNCDTFLKNASFTISRPARNAITVDATPTFTETVGVCSDIQFDARSLIGGGGRPQTLLATAVSTVFPPGTPFNPAAVIRLRNEVMRANTRQDGIYMFRRDILPINTQYTFRLRATNWVGQSDETTFNIRTSSLRVPNTFITGSRIRNITSSDIITLAATTRPNDLRPLNAPPQAAVCSNTTGIIAYSWRPLTSGITIPGSPTRSSIRFPAGFFSPGVYRFQLTAKYSDSNEITRSDVTISVTASPIELRIEGCDRVVSIAPTEQQSSIVLDAIKGSIDPDNTSPPPSWRFTWNCSRQLMGEDCGIRISPMGVVRIPVSNLSNTGQNNAFVFQVTAQDPMDLTRVATQKCSILTVQNPNSVLRVSADSRTNVALETISLTANAPPNANVTWSCKLIDGSRCPYPLSPPQIASRTRTQLVLNIDQLRPPGLTVRFIATVNATNPRRTGIGFVDVSVPAEPILGNCRATPPAGIAFNTTFALECLNWIGGENIQYEFSLSDKLTIIRGTSPNPLFFSGFPSPNPGTDGFSVSVRLTNDEGGSNRFRFFVRVDSPVLSNTTQDVLLSQSEEAFRSNAISGDLEGTTSELLNALSLVSGSSIDRRSRQRLTLSASIRDFIINGANSTQTLAQKASMIQLLVDEPNDIVPETAFRSLQGVDLLTEQILNRQADYSSDFGSLALATVANLVNVSSANVTLAGQTDRTIINVGVSLSQQLTSDGEALTASSSSLFGFFDLSTTQFTSTDTSGDRVSLAHTNASLDSLELPTSGIPGVNSNTSLFAVLSSSQNYQPPINVNGSRMLTQLGSVNVFRAGDNSEVEVNNVQEGIIIRITLDGLDPVDTSLPNATFRNLCMFFNETSLVWEPNGCTGSVNRASSEFICNCTHLTSFMGIQAPQPNLPSESSIKNAFNLNNLGRNPFVWIALLFILLCYLMVLIVSNIRRGEALPCAACCPMCCRRLQKDEEENQRALDGDFLVQFHVQQQHVKAVLNHLKKKRQAREIKSKGPSIGSYFSKPKVSSASLRSKPFEKASDSRFRSSSLHPNDRGRETSITFSKGLAFRNSVKLNPVGFNDGGVERVGYGGTGKGGGGPVGHTAIPRSSLPRADTVATSSEGACGGCWQCSCSKTQDQLREEQIRRLTLMSLKEALVHQRRGDLLAPNMESKLAFPNDAKLTMSKRIKRIFCLQVRQNHHWVGPFVHARNDAISSTWRANILLQTLLIVMCVSGMFYGVDRTTGGEVIIGIYTAIISLFLGFVLVVLARKIGRYDREIMLINIRNRLCISTRRRRDQQLRKIREKKTGQKSRSRSLPGGIVTLEQERSAQRKEMRRLKCKAKATEIFAWTTFILIASACAFTCLVIGIELDLQDDSSRDAGLDFSRSRSSQWLGACISAEVMQAIFFSPLVLFIKAVLVVVVFSSPWLLDFIISDDDIREVQAYDVFARVVQGYKLTKESKKKLRQILNFEARGIAREGKQDEILTSSDDDFDAAPDDQQSSPARRDRKDKINTAANEAFQVPGVNDFDVNNIGSILQVRVTNDRREAAPELAGPLRMRKSREDGFVEWQKVVAAFINIQVPYPHSIFLLSPNTALLRKVIKDGRFIGTQDVPDVKAISDIKEVRIVERTGKKGSQFEIEGVLYAGDGNPDTFRFMAKNRQEWVHTIRASLGQVGEDKSATTQTTFEQGVSAISERPGASETKMTTV